MKIARLSMMLSLTAILCLGIADGSAQARVVDRSAFREAKEKATYGLGTKVRTEETVTEASGEGVQFISSIRVFQYRASNEYRFINKSFTTNGTSQEVEEIRIGDTFFRRDNSKSWVKAEFGGGGGQTGSSIGNTAAQKTVSEYKVEAALLNGVQTDRFEEVQVQEINHRVYVTKNNFWVGPDGLLLQEETVEGTLSPRVDSVRTITKYDYDPNFKIEAPIP